MQTSAIRKLLLLLAVVLMAAGRAYAFIDSYTLKTEELPEPAREFLSTHFGKAKIGMIKVDRHLLKKTDYDVRLVNGTTIEFSNKGEWKSVDCVKKEVPEAIVPDVVKRQVKKNYPDVKIVRIEKKNGQYLVKLSDGVELKINLLGQVTVTGLTEPE